MGARGKQAQLAQANGSKFNLLLMLVAQMSTYPRAIATRYCSWGSRNFKPTHPWRSNCFRGPWGPPHSLEKSISTTLRWFLASCGVMTTRAGAVSLQNHDCSISKPAVLIRDEPTAWRPHLLRRALANAAPAGNQHQQASRRPSPPRAPLPRRRVRRGCADPAPPAGPSGAAGSGQPLGTLRSPPRPRGGANRAGERAPRSPQYNSQRGGSGSTEIWPLTNFWPGSIYIVLRWSLIPSYNRPDAFVQYWPSGFSELAPGVQKEVRVDYRPSTKM